MKKTIKLYAWRENGKKDIRFFEDSGDVDFAGYAVPKFDITKEIDAPEERSKKPREWEIGFGTHGSKVYYGRVTGFFFGNERTSLHGSNDCREWVKVREVLPGRIEVNKEALRRYYSGPDESFERHLKCLEASNASEGGE